VTDINHVGNMEIAREFINRVGRELEEAKKAEVGTCTYRHHIDIGHLQGMLAVSTTLLTLTAILSENLQVMKLVGTIIVHPKEATDAPPTDPNT